MSNRKAIFVLLVGIALLTAANVVLWYCRLLNPVDKGRSSLIDPAMKVSSLVIERRGASAIALVRDGRWRLVEPFHGSADEQMVLRLMDSLANEPIKSVLTGSEMRKLGRERRDFGLEDAILSVTAIGDKARERILFGSPTPSAEEVYAAVDGMDAIFAVSTKILTSLDVSANSFRRRSLFLVGPESISSFVIRHGNGVALEFARDESGWNCQKFGRASTQKVDEFLVNLMSVVADEFIWPVGATNESASASASLLSTYELDQDSAVSIMLNGSDGKDRCVVLGKAADGEHVYALAQNGTAIVTIPSSIKEVAAKGEASFVDLRIFPYSSREVSFFAISDGNVSCTFSKDANGNWKMETPIMAATDTMAVDNVLERLLLLTQSDVAKDGISVSFSTNAPITVSRENVLGGRQLEDLRSREIVDFDIMQVKRLVQSRAGGSSTMAVVYDFDRKVWNVEKSTINNGVVCERSVRGILSLINPLSAVRIEKLKVEASNLDDFGLGTPFATLSVDMQQDGMQRKNIIIGDRTSDGRYVTVGSSDAVFVVSEDVVKVLLEPLVEP